ncbi:MAG: hypothetical protein SGCHY_000815 [Lobulomycetales sp.]
MNFRSAVSLLVLLSLGSTTAQNNSTGNGNGNGIGNGNGNGNATFPAPPPQRPCVDIRRKEVRDMTTQEWQNFANAFRAVNSGGVLAMFVNWHIDAWTPFHFNEFFLPFHRCYLREFEFALMQNGADFLPYWESTFESQAPEQSVVLTSQYAGSSNGEHVVDGPFGQDVFTAAVGGGPLIRAYNPQGTGAFFAQSLIEDDIMTASFSEFSNRCEIGPHATVHSVLGGAGGHMSGAISPCDPLFWMHHAWIDKLWVDQQRRFPNTAYEFEANAFGRTANPNSLVGMGSWQCRVSDVMRTEDICISYAQPVNAASGDTGNGVVRAPEIAENFLNGTGANITFVEQLANETQTSADKISGGSSMAYLSVLAVVPTLLLAAML